MARSYQVTVGPAPAKVVLAGPTTGGGLTVTISNPSGSATDLYLGGDENEVPLAAQPGTATTVTSTTGFVLKPGTTWGPSRLNGGEVIYGVTNTNTVTAYVFRVSGRN